MGDITNLSFAAGCANAADLGDRPAVRQEDPKKK